MKYSLTFLYSLLLKDGYKVTDIYLKGEVYEITVTHPDTGVEWVIKLEPRVEDSVQNVLYQLAPLDSHFVTPGLCITGPIVVKQHVNK